MAIDERPLRLTTEARTPARAPEPLSLHFQGRLLTAVLGISSLVACPQPCNSDPDPVSTQYTLPLPKEGDCEETLPDGAIYDHYDHSGCWDITLVEQTEDGCLYEMMCEAWSCCGYGRPYLDADGQPVLSGVVERSDWAHPVAINAAGIEAADRAQLAAFWLYNAKSEHSSVAGFHRFALDLIAHGAPPELVDLAQQAAADELRHARDAFSLASVYAGRTLGPEPMALGTQAPVARTLAELAAWTLRDGAIGETLAAYAVAASAEQASDPVVRAILEQVAAEELEHAALAWKTLRWALDVGGAEVQNTLAAAFATLRVGTEPAERTTEVTVAHGILPVDERNAASQRCVDEVLRPVFASLLATQLAA